MNDRKSKYMYWMVAALLMALTFIAFSPVLQNQFLRYDDELYVYENPNIRSLTIDNVVWFLTHAYYKSYTPLTFLSHALDYRLWELDPFGHHLTNLLLHSFNTVLVFLLALNVFLLVRPRWLGEAGAGKSNLSLVVSSSLAALIFALHPLRVESVSWVSDRKDLLLGFFILPCLISYLRCRMTTSPGVAKAWMVSSMFFMVLALLSKTIAVMTPLVLVVMDVLFLESSELQFKKSLKQKIPFFIISLVFGYISTVSAGAEQTPYALKGVTEVERMMLPLYSFGLYIANFILPVSLMPVYLSPDTMSLILYSGIALAMAVVAIIQFRERTLWLPIALSFFLAYLLPTFVGLGAGIQPWADRYTYLPSVGLAIFLGGAALYMWGKGRQKVVVVIGGLLVVFYGTTSYAYMPKWRDSLSLWKHAIAAAPRPSMLTFVPMGITLEHMGHLDSAIAYYNKALAVDPKSTQALFSMGVAYEKMGDVDKALQVYQQAVEIDSENNWARNNLGNLLLKRGRVGEAISQYSAVVRNDRDNAEAYYNLGVASEAKGDLEQAIRNYSHAIAYVPAYTSAYVNLGAAYMRLGDARKATQTYERGIEFNAYNPVLYYNLGVASEAVGDSGKAIAHYTTAIQQKRDYQDAYINLGNLYGRSGMLENAAAVYEQAVTIGLDSADVLFNFGVVLEALGDGNRALQSYKRSIQKKSSYLDAYINCANLYARLGDLDSAAVVYKQALHEGLNSPDVRRNLAIIESEMKAQRK